jgi:5-methylcytosine-specific restriction endonuclease McrBC GTP-binding regulatory subunit McrB
MPFQPEQITGQHILQAIAELNQPGAIFRDSTGYDLVFENRRYPPKEIMRRAHRHANGEERWERSGGEPTNRYLTALGFTLIAKSSQNDPFPRLIKDYKTLLRTQGLQDEVYKWELLQAYKGRPAIEANDLLTEVKAVNFSNLIYGPGIGVIYHLARERAEHYRDCLRSLFDESTDLQVRIDYFVTEVQNLYREIEPDIKRQSHHDERTIATLLTYHNPDLYTFYKDSFYRTLCKVLGIRPADPGKKYLHYLSIVDNFIEDYIKDDQELLEMVAQHLSGQPFPDRNHKLLAQDILYRMLEINGRTFNTLLEELAATLDDDFDSPRFSVMQHTKGNVKNREWIWIADNALILNTTVAHYELEMAANNRDQIRLCLHFEDESNNRRFEEIIGKKLPENLEWFGWFKGRSIRHKNGINFYGEQAVPEIVQALKSMDLAIGEQVRTIIRTFKLENMKQMPPRPPLNQILYGPPGTGKTYHTVEKALQLLDRKKENMDRGAMKEAFDALVVEERIVFTSFHQSMGYEDFIEGFKPILGTDESAPIQYEIKSGIFKTICNAARGLQSIKTQKEDIFTSAKFYKMSLGGLQSPHIHDWCLKNNFVSLGWGGDKNFTEFKEIKVWRDYRDKFIREFPDLAAASRYNITAMYAFQQMNIGDIVVISKGNHIIDAIGRVTGEYEWDDNNDFGWFQFRKVEWLATDLNQQPSTFFRKQISQQSIYEFFDDDVKKERFLELFQLDEPELKPYVLIIDEINRGNIAKIFGELITLIEEDKRLGSTEGLTVTLPYSRDNFGVPSNLYIIGTMNTADRSVEALDTALRRRFSFKEMQPQPDLLSPAYTIWRFLWKYENLEWEDPRYLLAEDDLFKLLQPDEAFKESRKTHWGIFYDAWQNESQVRSLEDYAYDGIHLDKLLSTVNKRLEVLKDRDHLIGHAYFMNVYSVSALMTVFRDNIIPLLQEYFFGDYYKMQLVLGDGFIQSETTKVNFAKDDDGQYDDKEIYTINLKALNDSNTFSQAIMRMKI